MNLNDLNDRQKEAVLHTEGPLLVIAGAGSGKTRVLTYRIAYLIEEKGVDPLNILAITFTNKAAGEMKERVGAITALGERVWVSTFHSMCVRILRRFADRIGFTSDFTIYDTDDSKSLMKELFKTMNINSEYYKEREVLNKISSAKDKMISPSDMARQAEDDFRLKTIAELYSEYQNRMKKSNAMDFDDLIYMTVSLFEEDDEVLNVYSERFHYIMVDEYQDTNTSQFRLVNMLSRRWKNICVVGDDDQSIYRFRGANIENILGFENIFNGANVIKLEQNYRSTKNILEAANSVIGNNAKRKNKSLWTGNETGEKLSLFLFDNAYNEAEGIANDIADRILSDMKADEIAILYRTNAQSRLLEEKLVQANIAYRIYGGINFYQRKEIKDILAYLKLIVNDADNQAFKRVINVPKRGIGQTTLDKLQKYAIENGKTFFDAALEADEISDISAKTAGKINTFTEMILNFREMSESVTVEELTTNLLENIKYFDYLSENDTKSELEERINNIEELLNKIAEFDKGYDETYASNNEVDAAAHTTATRLSGFLEEVSLVSDPQDDGEGISRVSLMTLHAAKGLEFPVVYISGMEDGLFPGYQSIANADEDKTELEEERRLCYVGITRAKEKLVMTFARERMVRGERHINTLSRFVKEIPESYIETKNYSFVGDSFDFSKKKNDTNQGRFVPKNKARFDFRNLAKSIGTGTGAFKGIGIDELEKIISPERKTAPFGKDVSLLLSGTQKDKNVKIDDVKISDVKKDSDSGGFKKSETSPYAIGERVKNDRFGEGTVTDVEDMGRDWLVTVDFDELGTKKMFAGFINLKKM